MLDQLGRLDEAERWQGELEKPVRIQLVGADPAGGPVSPTVQITSEPGFGLHYRFDFPGGLKGYPVARVKKSPKADQDRLREWGKSRAYEIGGKTDPIISLTGYPSLMNSMAERVAPLQAGPQQ